MSVLVWSHFPDRAPRAVMNYGRCHPSTLAAILLVNVLDNLFTTFVFKIDIDIRRLVTLCRDEPFEQQINARGVDGRDP